MATSNVGINVHSQEARINHIFSFILIFIHQVSKKLSTYPQRDLPWSRISSRTAFQGLLLVKFCPKAAHWLARVGDSEVRGSKCTAGWHDPNSIAMIALLFVVLGQNVGVVGDQRDVPIFIIIGRVKVEDNLYSFRIPKGIRVATMGLKKITDCMHH